MSQKIKLNVAIEVTHKNGAKLTDEELRALCKSALGKHLERVLPWEIAVQAVQLGAGGEALPGSGELGAYVLAVAEIGDARPALAVIAGGKTD